MSSAFDDMRRFMFEMHAEAAGRPLTEVVGTDYDVDAGASGVQVFKTRLDDVASGIAPLLKEVENVEDAMSQYQVSERHDGKYQEAVEGVTRAAEHLTAAQMGVQASSSRLQGLGSSMRGMPQMKVGY